MQKLQETVGDGVKNVMIDKSKVEISALTALELAYFLCLFHVLQDWERFVRSAESGVKGDDNRATVLAWLKKLARTEDKALFKTSLREFKQW